MKKSSNLFVSAAIAGTSHFAIALLTFIHFAPFAIAYPGNQQRYNCYRKRDNQFSFGSPSNVSNEAILCTPNPKYRSRNRSRQRSRSSTQRRTSRKVYQNTYRNRNNSSEKIAIGLGSFAFGAFVGSAFWPWDWGWGGWGDIIIDDSINIIGDIGDIDIEIGDIGDLDDSVENLDLTELDESGDDFAGDDFGGDDFGSSDMGGSDFGGDDFGGDDFGGDDFGGDDFGGYDW